MNKPCKNAEPGTPHAQRPAPYPGPRCATCHRAFRRERTKSAHDKNVQRVYGLLPGQYDQLYAAQDGVCAICRIARGTTRRLAVDHNHATGEVRGLLCKFDNRLLGIARDNPEFFDRAAQYLRNPPARRVLG